MKTPQHSCTSRVTIFYRVVLSTQCCQSVTPIFCSSNKGHRSNGSALRAVANRHTDTHTDTPILLPRPLIMGGGKNKLSLLSCRFISVKDDIWGKVENIVWSHLANLVNSIDGLSTAISLLLVSMWVVPGSYQWCCMCVLGWVKKRFYVSNP